MVYEMAAGVLPFKAKNLYDMKDKILKIEYELPSRFSYELCDFLSKILVGN